MTAQETPVPIYIGLMLHAHTRKKELVDRLNHLGISISYDRVLRLSADIGNRVCEQFHREQVVCPPKLHGSVFTSAAVDNIDHNLVQQHQKSLFMALAFLSFSIPLMMVKEWIEVLSLIEYLRMQVLNQLMICHTSTLMCPLLMKALRSHLF